MRPTLSAAGRRLLTHPRIGDLYPEYLIGLHGIVRASVPLMEAGIRRGRDLAGDGVAEGLMGYLEAHIPEEVDHDEWLLEDLEVLGTDRDTVLARVPSPTIAGLVGAQYYWMNHYHPVALLGYIALLEGYPPSTSQIEDLIERTGHDRAAFRTLLHHADADPGHSSELFGTIDALPLSREQSAVLGVSAISTVHALVQVVEEIVARAEPA